MGKRKKRTETTASRKLLYLASHICCGIVVILVFLTLIQCTFKKPEAPTWDTKLVLPLVNKAYDMPELIDKIDQDNLITDSAGNPFFYYEKILDTVGINGSFVIDDITQNLSESLGVVQLDPFNGAGVAVNLTEFVPFATGDIPAMYMDIIEPLPPIGEFTVATVESGYALVTIDNNFGLDLDQVNVTIDDIVLSGQLTSYSIPGGIPAGVTQVDTISLGGKTVSNKFQITLNCHTPGATSFSTSDKSISATVSMPEGPTVSSATAQIPRIVRDFNEIVDINSDHILQTAILDDGQLVLNINNSSDVPANLVITLPDVKNGAASLVINQPVYANYTHQFIYDLSGYSLEPLDQTRPQTIPIDIQAVIDSSGTQQVTIDAGDRISVTVGILNVSLGSVEGIIAPTTAQFENIQQSIDLPKGFDQVQLTSATLSLEIENTVNIPGSFSINLLGDMGQLKTIGGTILPGTPEAPVTSIIIDSNIAAFMNPVPNTLTVNGTATFGDGVTIGSINPDNQLTARVILSSPLEMIIDSTTFDGDWESANIDQTDINKITDNINLANFYTTIVNRLPLGIEVEFLFGGDSATLYTNPQLTLGPIAVTRGDLNPDGTVSSSVVSENVLTLDSEQARILENSRLWVGQMYTLAGTDGQTVRFTATDSLSVTSYIEVDFTVSSDLWED